MKKPLWIVIMAGACLGAPIVAAGSPADEPVADIEQIREARDQARDALRQRDADVDAAREELRALTEERDALRERVAALEAERENSGTETAALRAELEQAIAATRRDRVTLAYNLGCVYKATRQYTRAEREFQRALQLAPDDAAIHFNLGILYDDHLNDRDKARHHYERFLELAPDDPDVPRVIQWLKVL